MNTLDMAKRAKETATAFQSYQANDRNSALNAIAESLIKHRDKIIDANKKDLEIAQNNNLSNALVDRLLLNEQRIQDMAATAKAIAEQPEVVGKINSIS